MGIIIRQSAKSTIVNYVGTFIGFISTMFVMTEFLTPEELGLTRVMLDIAVLLSGFFMLGIPSSGVRFFPYFKSKDSPNNNGFLFYMLLFVTIGTLIFGTIYVIFWKPITNYFAENSALLNEYFYYIIPMAIFLAFTGVFETYASVNMRIAVPRLFKEVILRLMNIAIVLMYFAGWFTLKQFIIAFVAIYGVLMLLNAFYIVKLTGFDLSHDNNYVDKPLRKKIYNYTFFLILGSIGSVIVGKIDVFMVSGMLGLAYSGIYSIAMYMAAIIEIPGRSILAISSPIAAEAIKNDDKDKLNSLFKKIALNQFLIGGMIFCLLWINIDAIFTIIPNSEVYSQGKYVVLFIGLTRLIDTVAGFSSVLLNYSKRYYYVLFLMFLLSGITITLNRIFIPLYEVSGAALATFITFIIYDTILVILVKRVLNVSPFSLPMLKVLCVIMIVLLLNMILPILSNIYIDAIYRTAIVSVIAMLIIYFWSISEDLNSTIRTILKKIFRHD